MSKDSTTATAPKTRKPATKVTPAPAPEPTPVAAPAAEKVKRAPRGSVLTLKAPTIMAYAKEITAINSEEAELRKRLEEIEKRKVAVNVDGTDRFSDDIKQEVEEIADELVNLLGSLPVWVCIDPNADEPINDPRTYQDAQAILDFASEDAYIVLELKGFTSEIVDADEEGDGEEDLSGQGAWSGPDKDDDDSQAAVATDPVYDDED